MDAKAAVAQAKDEIATLFADEGIKNVGLEEVAYEDDKDTWRITIGFSRPWDEPPRSNLMAALAPGQSPYWRRAYKVVHIDDSTGKVLSVKGLEVKA